LDVCEGRRLVLLLLEGRVHLLLDVAVVLRDRLLLVLRQDLEGNAHQRNFAARSDDFRSLVKDIAMHIAAQSPLYVRREDVPAEEIARERDIAAGQVPAGKPQAIIDKIVEGKLGNYYKLVCLYDQPFVKDDKQTVEQFITSLVAKIGEKIQVRRFVRFKTGEGLEKRSTDLAADVREALGE